MSKAFDKVNHGCLLQKIHELPVSSGMPQGSILGLMLFLISGNNLPDSILTSHVAMFAMTQKYINKSSLRNILRTYRLTCLLAT